MLSSNFIFIQRLVSPRGAGQAVGPAYAKRFGRAGNARLRKGTTAKTQTLVAMWPDKRTVEL